MKSLHPKDRIVVNGCIAAAICLSIILMVFG